TLLVPIYFVDLVHIRSSSIAQKATVAALGKENAGVRTVGNNGTRLDISKRYLGNLIAGRFSDGRDGGRNGNRFSVDSPGGYPYTVRPFCIRRNAKIACYITVRGDKAMQLLENGLKVKEYELLRCNCFGFGIQENINLGIKSGGKNVGKFSGGRDGGHNGNEFSVDSPGGYPYTVRPFCIRRNAKIACYITVRGDKAMQLLENGLKVKEYELLRCNCFGFGIQENIDLGIKYDPSTVSMGIMGGKQGQTYVVSDSTHGDHVKPPLGTLLTNGLMDITEGSTLVTSLRCITSVAMPTDVVRCIRISLKLSTSSVQNARSKSRQLS
ncbi:60S ribosomal protein L11 isoform X2, partial [Tanacetum coccineum]